MEQMTVPLLTLVTGIIIWCAWLTRELYRSQKDIAINTANDGAVKSQILEVKDNMTVRIDKLESHFDKKFDQVSQKFEKVFQKIDEINK